MKNLLLTVVVASLCAGGAMDLELEDSCWESGSNVSSSTAGSGGSRAPGSYPC